MVEQERPPVDVLSQTHAVQAALSRVENELLKAHLERLVSGAVEAKSAADRDGTPTNSSPFWTGSSGDACSSRGRLGEGGLAQRLWTGVGAGAIKGLDRPPVRRSREAIMDHTGVLKRKPVERG